LDPASELLQIVSSRTGYPVEMLDLDLDIEADLSIDSIKRIEIIGALDERLGFRNREGIDRDRAMEQLVGIKTLRSIVAWLDENIATRSDAGTAVAAVAAVEETVRPDPTLAQDDVHRCTFVLERAPNAAMNGFTLQDKRFVLTEDAYGICDALRKMIEAKGASVEIAGPGVTADNVDGLLHLASLSSGASTASIDTLFDLTRRIIPNGATHLLAATGFGGAVCHGPGGNMPLGGLAGFVKSITKEWPDLHARVVDLDTSENAQRLAEHLYAELLADDDLLEVGYTAGARQVRRISRSSLPTSDGKMDLGRESVILVTGGARGITAQISIALAERWGCRLELVGRSPLPKENEPAEFATAGSLPEIRKAIIETGRAKEPAHIEAIAKGTLAAREIRETLTAIGRIGSPVTYHSVDVRNTVDFAALIESIYSRFGRIDGVIHGAGVIEDKLLTQKTAESFRRVFETKVRPALTLAEKIRPDVKFVMFFSSLAGVFGNRGQADYAAASEALDKLAYALAPRMQGRVASINWGPWAEVGMVSPQLQKEYTRRGVRTISPRAGVKAFIDELCKGGRADVQVAWFRDSAEILL
jgi:NAD(P)-dependent dehydrogenase (short-subunit alcohol dehydrogenase family)/acyl carrier protein